MSADWQKELMQLRILTEQTGILHSAQQLNLQQWGALAFHASGKWTATIDLEDRLVTYTLLTPSKKPHIEPNVVAGLVTSVHWLLGPTWGVNVKHKEKLIFEGPREERDVRSEDGTGSPRG